MTTVTSAVKRSLNGEDISTQEASGSFLDDPLCVDCAGGAWSDQVQQAGASAAKRPRGQKDDEPNSTARGAP